MYSKMIFSMVVAVLIGGGTALAQSKFDETRVTLEKWVETRQLIERRRGEWQTDKDALQQSVALLKKEVALLDEQIARAQATATQADKDRAKLEEENEQLSAAAAEMEKAVTDLERDVLEVSKAFPAPLMEKIEPLFKRIPRDSATARLSAAQRMQNVVGILAEAGKFDAAIHVASELRRNPAGADVQVRTVYLGLARAYFVDRSGQFAGVGVPGGDGWQWTPQNELAGKISKVIHIYENNSAAEFVSLPMEVK
jgi:transposase-like protein